MAPGIEPMPPTTAAVNPFRPAMKPMKWKMRPKTSPVMTPPRRRASDPIRNVVTMTLSTSIPIIAAASRSYDVALIALPSFVRPTSRVNTIMSANADAMTMIRSARSAAGPRRFPSTG